MLAFFRKFFFVQPEVVLPSLSANDILIQHLESEISFLREQVKLLQERSTPQVLAPKIVEPLRPQKFDPITLKYVPKTDVEIESDRQGLRELGII